MIQYLTCEYNVVLLDLWKAVILNYLFPVKLGFCTVGMLPAGTFLCMGSLLLLSFERQLPPWEIDTFF